MALERSSSTTTTNAHKTQTLAPKIIMMKTTSKKNGSSSSVAMKKKKKCHRSLHTIIGQFEDWFMINRLETSKYGDKMLRHVERALEKYGPCITQERDARGRLPTDRLLAIVADAEDADDDDDDDERFINKVAINRSKRALDMIEGAAQDLL